MIEIKKNITILTQGDSITDAGRNYEDDGSWGFGYSMIIGSILMGKYPEYNLKFINKGISGNRVCDLKNRWEADTLAYSPDILSIMIGVNDMWRRYDSDDPTPAFKFEEDYRFILEKSKAQGSKIIIIEPFLNVVREEMQAWKDEDLYEKISVCRKLAGEYAHEYIALEDIMQEMIKIKPADFWSPDGVHPSNAGHGLIAEEYLNLLTVK